MVEMRKVTRRQPDALKRLTWLAAAALLWAVLILGKLLLLQVIHHHEYARLAHQQQEMKIDIPAPRGPIVDRTGQPLALSVPMQSVYVNPLHVPDLWVASELLGRMLKMEPSAHRRS